jgi:hypothetical protein
MPVIVVMWLDRDSPLVRFRQIVPTVCATKDQVKLICWTVVASDADDEERDHPQLISQVTFISNDK